MTLSRQFIPRVYQTLMFDHVVSHPRCALFVPMGMGKSSATLMSLDALSLVRNVFPALVLAPLRVARSTWSDEVAKWNEFKRLGISTITGGEEQRVKALKQHADIFTINYENLVWLREVLGDRWPFKTVVSDESTKLKSFRLRQGSVRAAALRDIAHTKVTRWLNLSGSPAPNGLKDLWGQLWFLDQGSRLGRTYTAFEQRWFAYQRQADAFDHQSHAQMIILPGAQDEIQNRIKDICLSIKVSDYFDIAEPVVVPIYVTLPPAARKLYRDMERKMFMEIEGHQVEAFNAAAKTGKCLQIAAGAAYIDPEVAGDSHPKAKDWKVIHNEKIEALESILEEAGGMPVLVGYSFKSDLVRLKKAFPQGRHIKTKQDEDDFKAGKISIGFAHPASLGHGVDGFQNVTNIVVFFSADWNFENFYQFIERIGPVRQFQAGFDRNVFVYIIIARDTMDEDVLERHQSKRSVQDILLDAMNRRRNLDA